MGLVTEPDARDVDALFDRVLHADDPAPSAAFEARNAAGLPRTIIRFEAWSTCSS